MSTITVYGYSDDLVEVEGAITEEFDCVGREGWLLFSDGTQLEVSYDGFWNIRRRFEGTSAYERIAATDRDTDYSDRVTLSPTEDAPFQWVAFVPGPIRIAYGTAARRAEAKA